MFLLVLLLSSHDSQNLIIDPTIIVLAFDYAYRCPASYSPLPSRFDPYWGFLYSTLDFIRIWFMGRVEVVSLSEDLTSSEELRGVASPRIDGYIMHHARLFASLKASLNPAILDSPSHRQRRTGPQRL